MNSIQEMLIEKYTFTKAPAGPHHDPSWLCIDCSKKLEDKYDFYPYCINCRVQHLYEISGSDEDSADEAEIYEVVMLKISNVKKKMGW